jgi:hypothetical protein
MDHALQIPPSTLDAVGSDPTRLFENMQVGTRNAQKCFEFGSGAINADRVPLH